MSNTEESAPPPVTSRVDLGSVSLTAAPGWQFFPLDNRVVGRPASGVGGVQVVRLPLTKVGWPATHEVCMAAAVAVSELKVEPPGFDRAKEQNDCCVAGGESFRGDNDTDFVRIWYRHCPDGMLAAWFACKEKRAGERAVVESLRDCDRMIASMRVPPSVS